MFFSSSNLKIFVPLFPKNRLMIFIPFDILVMFPCSPKPLGDPQNWLKRFYWIITILRIAFNDAMLDPRLYNLTRSWRFWTSLAPRVFQNLTEIIQFKTISSCGSVRMSRYWALKRLKVVLGCASCNSYASFVLSKLPKCSISRHTYSCRMNQLFYYQWAVSLLTSGGNKEFVV